MTKPLRPFRTTAVTAGMCIMLTFAAQAAYSSSASAPASPLPVSEDPVAWKRDPFIGSGKKPVVLPSTNRIIPKKAVGALQGHEPDIQLQGIMQTDKNFHALINGRTVKAGDTIAGVTIKQISRFKVVVLNERKEKITYDIYQGRIDRGIQ